MDFLTAVAAVAAEHPQTAGIVAMLPLVQLVAALGAKLTKRAHPTVLNTVLGKVAAFPMPAPKHPAA